MSFTKFKEWVVIREMGAAAPVAPATPTGAPIVPTPAQDMARKQKLGQTAARIAQQMQITPGKVNQQQKQMLLNNPQIQAAGDDMADLIKIITGE